MITLALLVVAVLVAGEWKSKARRTREAPGSATRWDRVDLTALRLAIDWRARPYVQARLAALAAKGDTGSAAGLLALLRETCAVLEAVRLAWLYGAVDNHRPMGKELARERFVKLGIDARARFEEELVRNEDGATRERAASPRPPRADEGPGVVVVTVVVAARREILDVPESTDARAIDGLLRALAALREGELVALEVVWSPADEDDRMSTAELEALYPDLAKLDEASIGGRVFCDHCRGPYADELAACPHCGASHARPHAPRAPGDDR